MKTKKQIAVVGLGYVGLPLAILSDKRGHRVIGIDIDEEKIKKLKNHEAPFVDEGVIKDLGASKIEFGTDFSVLKSVDIIIICVPTPVYKDHMPNLEPLKSAGASVGKYLQKGQLVILESTVNPGVSENILLPILEKESGLKGGTDFQLAHCPERINPGDKEWGVENIHRVLGSLDKKGLDIARDFYGSIITGEIKEMGSLKEAEAVKIIENTFRDVNIAFVNELAKSFERMGIDLPRVLDGAATKPFAFLPHYPGCGIGGHCIPVDPYYLINEALENGFDHKFLKLAREINNSMPGYSVELLTTALNKLKKSVGGTRVGVLGVAYKGNIDDVRESPAFEIIKLLRELGAEVYVYDPYVASESNVESLDKILDKSEALILATAHKEFIGLEEKLGKTDVKVIVDGRNMLDKEKIEGQGIVYMGIGR